MISKRLCYDIQTSLLRYPNLCYFFWIFLVFFIWNLVCWPMGRILQKRLHCLCMAYDQTAALRVGAPWWHYRNFQGKLDQRICWVNADFMLAITIKINGDGGNASVPVILLCRWYCFAGDSAVLVILPCWWYCRAGDTAVLSLPPCRFFWLLVMFLSGGANCFDMAFNSGCLLAFLCVVSIFAFLFS